MRDHSASANYAVENGVSWHRQSFRMGSQLGQYMVVHHSKIYSYYSMESMRLRQLCQEKEKN